MAYHNAQQVYLRNQYETASPAELTLQLYNGAIRFLGQAREAIERQEIETANDRLHRTQDIIQELMLTLDTSVNVGRQLEALYDYMLFRLTQANVKKDAAVVEEVTGLLTELRDAWKEVVKYARQQVSVEVGL